MNEIADHWATGDVFGRIVDALRQAGKSTAGLTVDDLSPIDHYHARGRAATVELADMLDIRPEHRILDIGCGVGGPARYVAARFGCRVVGIDIAQPFVAAAEGLTRLVGMASQVTFVQGDGQRLPQQDAEFDGAFTQHVTMNVADRAGFFRETFRVLKPGGFFALTVTGLALSANRIFRHRGPRTEASLFCVRRRKPARCSRRRASKTSRSRRRARSI